MTNMSAVDNNNLQQQLESIFRAESGRVRATLIGSLRDFELAEDVLQEAFVAALERWPHDGLPTNPAAWLLVTARRKAIDRLRRAQVLARKQVELQLLADLEQQSVREPAADPFPDERLKLIFTCCHPALNLDIRVALTLQTLGGLSTAEVARAFLISEITMAQRLVRAKRKIRDAAIPYIVPATNQLTERLDGVLMVLYLIFNAGYTASLGKQLVRSELCNEAMRLSRALVALLESASMYGAMAEARGLLALMLLHDARRAARVGPGGELITLEDQDRTLWDKAQCTEGITILDQALTLHKPGPYQIQAAISALHAQAGHPAETDWLQISLLYGGLLKLNHSPVVRLNWAVAVAMATTPARGLDLLAELAHTGLHNYYLFHAARADLLRRNGAWLDAQVAYQNALDLVHNCVEEAFLQRRLTEVMLHLQTRLQPRSHHAKRHNVGPGQHP